MVIVDRVDEAGGSSNEDKISIGSVVMDTDESNIDESDDEVMDLGLDNEFLLRFCKKASIAFFEQYGLISHQINSYNKFIEYGIQKVFNSIDEIMVEPAYDPSERGDGDWRYASVKFGEVKLEPPTLWTGEKFFTENSIEYLELLPRHARLQNMTYSARMTVQTQFKVYTIKPSLNDKFKTGNHHLMMDKEIESDEVREIFIGRIPIMVNSDLCWMNQHEEADCDFEHGGYFIIKGAEKVGVASYVLDLLGDFLNLLPVTVWCLVQIFIAQEQICLKRVWVSNSPTWMISYRTVDKRRRVYVKLMEIVKFKHISGGEKSLSVSFFVAEMPIWILFFALGVTSDKEVIDLIEPDVSDSRIANIVIASIGEADDKSEDFRKGDNAIAFIESQFRNCQFPPTESVEECFSKYLFPSLSGFKKKARFLGYMAKCLLQAYVGRRKFDNRDELRNKRLELAGELLERELRVHLRHAQRRMVKALQKDLYDIRMMQPIDHYLDASIVTNGLSRAFSTGAWSHPYKKMARVPNVVATLRRTNPLQMTADMRKTCQQVSYTGKVGDARYPHPSHWGRICFLSTPDGENCGLVKNLASLGLVSTDVLEDIQNKLLECGMEPLINDSSTVLHGKHKIFIDGDWVGMCEDSASFVAELRQKRCMREVPQQVEVKRDEHHGEVRIYTDAGRILRPLLVVENIQKVKAFEGGSYSFELLLDTGIIELLGPEEEEDCNTAWGVGSFFAADKEDPPTKYTHVELDMSFLLGLSCGLIPFANHDHAKRVLYQSEKHSQQAMGFGTTNPEIRVDTNTHQLFYPQRPLFCTMLSDCLGKSSRDGPLPRPEYYNGQCAIVAVNVHLGYNQEDSLVMNRTSLERGMFRTEHIRSFKSEIENNEGGRKMKPEDIVSFGKTQSEIGCVDSLDDDGFPFIGAKLMSGDIVIGKYSESGVDHSVKLKHTERGTVQKVVLSANDDGKSFAAVSLRQIRSPCGGDKFSSMHGQKGVLGFLESQENLPFTKQGIVPDIVINPHAFPSRQTLGQLLETALGKGIALGGGLKSATPFSTSTVEDITAQLHRLGFTRWGNERVCTGRTGEIVESLVFMGPTFYQRLTHMSEDKVKFRNTGPVHPFTRQPVADRKRFGGVKFGEMERDCLIAHGAAANLHERLFTLSDSSQMHICHNCKTMANVIKRPAFGEHGGHKVLGPYCKFCESTEDIVLANVPYGAKLLSQELFSMGITLKFDAEVC